MATPGKPWPLTMRDDGRAEIVCPHGVGHPVASLSRRWDASWMSVHGCDGCCDSVAFEAAEQHHLTTPRKP